MPHVRISRSTAVLVAVALGPLVLSSRTSNNNVAVAVCSGRDNIYLLLDVAVGHPTYQVFYIDVPILHHMRQRKNIRASCSYVQLLCTRTGWSAVFARREAPGATRDAWDTMRAWSRRPVLEWGCKEGDSKVREQILRQDLSVLSSWETNDRY